MLAYITFLGSVVGIFLILKRRFKLTGKDIALQNKVLREEQLLAKKKVMSPLKIIKETALKVRIPSVGNKKAHKNVQISELYKKADAFEGRGQNTEAVQMLLQILSIDENHVEANKKLGFIYLKMGDNLKAEYIFKKLLNFRRDAPCLSNLGLALYNQGKLREAADSYEESIRLERTRAGLPGRQAQRLISLGHVYHGLKEYEKALTVFEQAHKIEPKNIECLFIMAQYYEMKQDWFKARQLTEQVLRLDPYNEEARGKLKEMIGLGGTG